MAIKYHYTEAQAIADRRRAAKRDDEFRRVSRLAQEQDPSDPFVYGRTLANLRSGAHTVETVYLREEKKNG